MQLANNMRCKLNHDQNVIANTIIEKATDFAMIADECNVYYVDGPGGTGKTFTYNYLTVELCSRGYNVATAAWTGIATTLLIRGRTVHSLFKLPVPLLETSTCKISPTFKHAEYLCSTCLIIIDEASMVSIHAFNAIDRMLSDITSQNIPFGGKVVLFGGDFHQVLPVVRHGHPSDIIENCIKRSEMWTQIHQLHLKFNMRTDEGEHEFATWLMKLGNDELPKRNNPPFQGCIEIPKQCVSNLVITDIFNEEFYEHAFAERIILCPTNDESLKLNGQILNKVPGDARVYLSADEVVTDDDFE